MVSCHPLVDAPPNLVLLISPPTGQPFSSAMQAEVLTEPCSLGWQEELPMPDLQSQPSTLGLPCSTAGKATVGGGSNFNRSRVDWKRQQELGKRLCSLFWVWFRTRNHPKTRTTAALLCCPASCLTDEGWHPRVASAQEAERGADP